jgi:type I site-specific restriction endonuclease
MASDRWHRSAASREYFDAFSSREDVSLRSKAREEDVMTEQTLTVFLDGLEQAAHTASAAEENFRREVAERLRAVEQERAFGFRRLNLMRSVTAAIAAGKDEDEALAKGREVFLHELQITTTSEANQETLHQFEPVLRACWDGCQSQGDDASAAAAIVTALKEFETWFGSVRNGSVLTLMEREIVELPLVEVC